MRDTIIKNPSWWCRRTLLERNLLIFASMFFIIALVLFISLIYFFVQKPVEICTTPTCISTALNVLERMDQNVDPCDNFYEFACGSFIKNTEIPPDKTSVISLALIKDKVQDQIIKTISEPIKTNETKSFVLAKQFYKACLDESKIELLGLGPMKRILSQLGGWPVIEGNSWDETNFDWKNLTYNLKRRGFIANHLINLYSDTDLKRPKKRVLQLAQSNLELSRELLVADITDKSIYAYFDYMIDVAMIFGANKSYAEKELEPALMFQRKLAEISLPQTELRNASANYNPMFIEELQVKYPSIPWLEFINNILSPVLQVENEEIVINQIPSFFLKLEELLKTTPKRTVANYLLWQAVKNSISALPQSLKTAQLNFLRVGAGVNELPPRFKTCVSGTYKYFDIIIGAMYVRKYFNHESKKKAAEIFENIRDTFKDNLENVDWLDEETRKSALEKLAAINANVAYPDELFDDEKLNQVYEKVQIKENKFFESILLLNKWEYDFMFSNHRKPINKNDWLTHGDAATIGAFYTFTENAIQIPAGILQDVFFSSDRPNYMNYGAIGFTIGHEITHGFDNEGRQFNKDGIVANWWASSTEDAFLKKSKCIIEQYNNYTIAQIGQNVDGELTEGENIADNGGIKEAYRAYKKWVKQNNIIEPQLPGLPYTPEQMFWISNAHTWCSKDTTHYLQILRNSDVHAPYAFRIIGAMSNRPEFAADFNCPIGSNMNPQRKCHIW